MVRNSIIEKVDGAEELKLMDRAPWRKSIRRSNPIYPRAPVKIVGCTALIPGLPDEMKPSALSATQYNAVISAEPEEPTSSLISTKILTLNLNLPRTA